MALKKNILPFIALILALIITLFAIYQMNKIPDSPYPQMHGEFSLQQMDGTFSFKDMAGKSGLIFFGYTHCPDVCPAILVNLGKALDLLDKSEQEKVIAVFISVDPERDTPEIMTKYVKYFHSQIIGLSGDKKEVERAAKSFYIGHEKNKPNEKGNYTITHATSLYLIRPDGLIGEIIGHNSTPEEIATALRRWLPWAD